MASGRSDALLATKRRIRERKSIAYMPSPDITLSLVDRENATTTVLSDTGVNDSIQATSRTKRSRSLSIGPGGLEALREDAGNKRKMPPAPTKSILKPSIKISPLKPIPSRKTPELPNATRTPDQSPRRSGRVKSPLKKSPVKTSTAGLKAAANDVEPSTQEKIVGSEERVKHDKEEEARQRKEARRKSLAARRVSFAAEATLHTWEDMHDSTASTISTEHSSKADSTIGQDGVSEQNASDGVLVSQSPAQRSKSRRRSSVIPPLNFNNPDDDFSSSPSCASSSSDDENSVPLHNKDEEIVISSSESEDEEDLRPVHEGAEPDIVAVNHVLDDRDDASPPENSISQSLNLPTCDENVFDATEDVSMDLAGDEITRAFQPWAQKNAQLSKALQENLNPFSPAFKLAAYPSLPVADDQAQDNDGMSMDMTRAVGGIIQSITILSQTHGIQPGSPSRRSRRRSSGSRSSLGGETMEFTTAVGGIQTMSSRSPDRSILDENEELSMEFTSVFGGIQARNSSQQLPQPILDSVDIAEPEDNTDEDGDMEMTTAFGGLLESVVELQAIENDETNMDITRAFGTIIQPTQLANSEMPETSAVIENSNSKPLLRTSTRKSRLSVGASATGSPMVFSPPKLWPRDKGYIHQVFTPTRALKSMAAKNTPKSGLLKVVAPQKEATPRGARPTSPGKTPLSTNVTMHNSSPRRLFQDEIALSSKTLVNGVAEPAPLTSTLLPKQIDDRRLSGLGVDKVSLRSPKVAALLDRRAAIGDSADIFVAQPILDRGVRFQDPRALYIEAIQERADDERRESGRFILEQEANETTDEKDSTTTLKERIESMTPKKNKLKGRKSLAPGGAKGILGKRPVELDEDDEDGTPLALKHRSMTPVKKVKLNGPPSKLETIGRPPGSARRTLTTVSGNERFTTPSVDSPDKLQRMTTPKTQGRFKDAEALPTAQKPIPTLGREAQLNNTELNDTPDAKDRIHLQDFLNMTSIRFMELNTTKRRHTIAPGNGFGTSANEDFDQDQLFEEAVVASACTVPMLELFQHSCRELKKYISEGRDIVHEIEAETYEDNPPLFQEYMSASPTERSVMDTQFKNMKTYARLTSKGMWYEWRMKLLEGLKTGLAQVSEGMARDDAVLTSQETVLEKTLPSMLQEHESLTDECMELQAKADEIPEHDKEELDAVRAELSIANAEIEEKRRKITEYQQKLRVTETGIQGVKEAKEECAAAMKEAKRVCEECRGWTATEVALLKSEVMRVEATSGWTIVSASSTNLTLVYNQNLQLFFNVASFMPAAEKVKGSQNSPISLTYIGDTAERHPSPLTTEKRFFLQLMRAHLQCLNQHQVHLTDLLRFVSTGWSSALAVVDEIRRLDRGCVTSCSILSDERLEVKAMMLLPELKTKVQIAFEVGAAAETRGIKCRITPKVDVAYGEPFKSNKMADFLKERVVKDVGTGSWARTFEDLKSRLVARGKK